MQTLAYLLGAVEIILVPVSIAWLLWAAISLSQARVRRATTLALVIAATVAQPFGIVAKKQAGLPRGTHVVSSTGIHINRIAGMIPVLPFALYRESSIITSDTSAKAVLKARSWFWLPILTNGTAIKSICSNDLTEPCWDPNTGDRSNLTLSEAGGRYYVTLRNPLGPRFLAPSAYTWELVPGIASVSGLIYWIVIGLSILFLRTRLANSPPEHAIAS